MHNAVNARLANPEMSLFEALIAGGFQYPATEDATAVDAEGVSLGQRKNQLSRRLRLARKQNHGSSGRRSDADSHSTERSLEGVNAAGSAASLSGNAQRELQRLVQNQGSNAKRPAPTGGSKLAARALQMKQDQGDIGDLSDEENPYASANQQNEEAKRPRVAKFHPDFAPLFVPPVSSVRNGGMNAKQMEPPPDGAPHAMNMANAPGGQPSSLFTQQLANPFAQQQNQNRPSAVAISSLTHSAQAVGLTLEQLAMNLASNTTTLAKVLAENLAPDAEEKKMSMAMRLFENEVKGLYSRVMHMSGFDPRECQPHTTTYREFARKVWKKEARRLRTAGLGDDLDFEELENNANARMASAVAAVADMESLGKDMDSHSHSHDHSKHDDDDMDADNDKKPAARCDSRHVHRIDGQCGHKAIIHKPKNGNAHIDFVVGDKVECYHGIEPVGRNSDTAWPSRYKCKDAGEHGNCGSENYKDLYDVTPVPKVIELSAINLQDPEWNYDVTGSIDGGVAGLFRLGGRSGEDISTSV